MYVVVTNLFTGLVIECHRYLFLQLIAYQYARCINVYERERENKIFVDYVVRGSGWGICKCFFFL